MRSCINLLLLLFCLAANAQNLVRNGDFEDSVACQEKWDSNVTIPHWETFGTVDIYNEDCKTKFNKDASNLQVQSGKQYLGYVYLRDYAPSEYFNQRLTGKLSAGCDYEITVYVALGGFSYQTLKEYYVVLADSPYEQLKTNRVFLRLKGDSVLAKNHWTKFSTIYTAKGGEQFLSFKADVRYSNPVVLDKMIHKFVPNCYLLIDNVSIVKTQCPEVVEPDIPVYTETVANDTFVVSDVNFDVNSFQLKTDAAVLLLSIVNSVKPLPYKHIHIVGHTDNSGTVEINKKLSEDRANAVKDYLVNNGIDSSRISIVGKGDTLPIADNNTAAGRQKNRRVEVIVERGN